MVAVQLLAFGALLAVLGWFTRGTLRSALTHVEDANIPLFVLACAVLAAYYLAFVLGWIRILDDWGVAISYPAALRAEMVSMLAKYIPGGIWAPVARVAAARRFGITDAWLVTASMLLEAGISAAAGVLVFVISLVWVKGVDAPIAPIVCFGVAVAVLVHPRVFRAVIARMLRRLGYRRELPPLRGDTVGLLVVFYAGTWVLGGFALWLLLRSVGAHPAPSTIIYLGGTAAIGAIVAVLAFFAPSGLGVREGTVYTLMLAVAPSGQALAATALNRVAITVVEVLLLVVGGLFLRAPERSGEPSARLRDAEA
jgi:glycosyltransferase 2 family protein